MLHIGNQYEMVRPIYAHTVISCYFLAHISFMHSWPISDFCDNRNRKKVKGRYSFDFWHKNQCVMHSTSLVVHIHNPLNAENLPMDGWLNSNSAQLVTNALHHGSYEAKVAMLLGSATKACSKIGTLATSEDEPFKGVYTPFDKVVLNKTCGFAFVPCTNLDDTTKVVIAASEYAL